MINSVKKSDFVFNQLCKICSWCGYHLLSTDETTALLRLDTDAPPDRDCRYDWAIDSIDYTYSTRILGMNAKQIFEKGRLENGEF